tara:strand:+ start:14318 stop:14560 length:243 start_codon:yes stop_codon:yes gene_type:complete
MTFVTDHASGLYCDRRCAEADNADTSQLERYTPEKLLSAKCLDDDRLWYDDDNGSGLPSIRMPQFGHCCNNDDCGAILWE